MAHTSLSAAASKPMLTRPYWTSRLAHHHICMHPQSPHHIQAEKISVTGVVCHVANKDQRAALINHTLKTHGKLDVLVSNAAVSPTFGPLSQVHR